MASRLGSQRKTVLIVTAIALSMVMNSGCQSCGRNRPDGRKPLQVPADAKPAKYEPRLPFKEIGPNILARTMYSDDTDKQYVVEAQELAVPPGKTASDLKLRGAAIFQLREGSAVARIGDRNESIAPGGAFTVAEGASVTLENKRDRPLFFRVHVVKTK